MDDADSVQLHPDIGILCTLSLELEAVIAVFDDSNVFSVPLPRDNSVHAKHGKIAKQQVAAVCCPFARHDASTARLRLNCLRQSYPSIRICFVVGIAGGVPDPTKVDCEDSLHLGDVVIADYTVPYDAYVFSADRVQYTEPLKAAPSVLLSALSDKFQPHLSQLEKQLVDEIELLPEEWKRPDGLADNLYGIASTCKSPGACQCNDDIFRVSRTVEPLQRIHVGVIASGSYVVRDAQHREELRQTVWMQYQRPLVALDRQSAYLHDCIIVRSICDYTDYHKNKRWQDYAAANAAVCLKLLLPLINLSGVQAVENTDEQDLGGEVQVQPDMIKFEAHVSAYNINLRHPKDHDGDAVKSQMIQGWNEPIAIVERDQGSRPSRLYLQLFHDGTVSRREFWIPNDEVGVQIDGLTMTLRFSDCKQQKIHLVNGVKAYRATYDHMNPNVDIELQFDRHDDPISLRALLLPTPDQPELKPTLLRAQLVSSQSSRASNLESPQCVIWRSERRSLGIEVHLFTKATGFTSATTLYVSDTIDFELGPSRNPLVLKLEGLKRIQHRANDQPGSFWPSQWIKDNYNGEPHSDHIQSDYTLFLECPASGEPYLLRSVLENITQWSLRCCIPNAKVAQSEFCEDEGNVCITVWARDGELRILWKIKTLWHSISLSQATDVMVRASHHNIPVMLSLRDELFTLQRLSTKELVVKGGRNASGPHIRLQDLCAGNDIGRLKQHKPEQSFRFADEKELENFYEGLRSYHEHSPDRHRTVPATRTRATGKKSLRTVIELNWGTYSDLSYIPSLTSSATGVDDDDDSDVQAALEHFVGLLYEDSFLQDLFREDLQKLGGYKFAYNNERLLKAYFRDLLKECATAQQKDVIRMLNHWEQREEISTLIRDLSDSNRVATANALEAILQQKPHRVNKLEEFLIKEHNALRIVPHDVDDSEDPVPGSSALAENILQLAIDRTSGDGDNGSPSSEGVTHPYSNLKRMENLFTGGQAFARYRAHLHYLLRPPSSLTEVLESADIHILEQFIDERFQELVIGDYEWLLELEETGYSRREMAELLMEDARDSPWITFEPRTIDTHNIQVDKHVPDCPHTLLGRTTGDVLDPVSSSTAKSADPEVLRLIEELCGLGGVIPQRQDDETWKGQVVFEDDFTTSKISYEVWLGAESSGRIIPAIYQSLTRFCIAAALAQAGGICCDRFTVLNSNVSSADVGSDRVLELWPIKLRLAVRLLRELGVLRASGKKFSVSNFQDCTLCAQEILGYPASSPLSLADALNYCALAVQFLCVMFLSYVQGHAGPLDLFFLGAAQQKIVLLGNRSFRHQDSDGIFVECALVNLKCLGDMIKKPVLTFQLCSSSQPAVYNDKARYDINASIDDILDIWGPGDFIYHREYRHRLLAIRIGGGYVFQPDSNGLSLHWSPSMPLLTLDRQIYAVIKYRIGAAVRINTRCSLDEDVYRQEHRGCLYQLGTHRGFYQAQERQVGIQAGQYINVSCNVTSKWVPPRSVKTRILELDSNNPWLKLSADLKNTWGLQVSLCTGIARRVTLGELLAELLPKFTDPTKPQLWDELQAKGIISILNSGDLATWLNGLDPDLEKHLLGLITYILNYLESTGVDREREHLVVAWPVLSDLHRCLKIRLNQQQTSWARLLADSDQCATFACATTKCFVTDGPRGVQCRGRQPWERAGKLLGTAFSCQEPLRNNGSYRFQCCHSLLLIQVDRPPMGVPHLIVKRSMIPSRLMKRVMAFDRAKSEQLIYERQSHKDPSEDVIVRAIEI